MKKLNAFSILIVFMLVIFTLMPGCSDGQKPSDYDSTGSETQTEAEASKQKTLTVEELAEYNGKDGQPAYIAIDGKVYDVSDVPQWAGGDHAGMFEAGKDYTNELKTQAPHSASLLQGTPVVGVLAE